MLSVLNVLGFSAGVQQQQHPCHNNLACHQGQQTYECLIVCQKLSLLLYYGELGKKEMSLIVVINYELLAVSFSLSLQFPKICRIVAQESIRKLILTGAHTANPQHDEFDLSTICTPTTFLTGGGKSINVCDELLAEGVVTISFWSFCFGRLPLNIFRRQQAPSRSCTDLAYLFFFVGSSHSYLRFSSLLGLAGLSFFNLFSSWYLQLSALLGLP